MLTHLSLIFPKISGPIFGILYYPEIWTLTYLFSIILKKALFAILRDDNPQSKHNFNFNYFCKQINQILKKKCFNGILIKDTFFFSNSDDESETNIINSLAFIEFKINHLKHFRFRLIYCSTFGFFSYLKCRRFNWDFYLFDFLQSFHFFASNIFFFQFYFH